MRISVVSAEFVADRVRRDRAASTCAYYEKQLRWMAEHLEGQGVTDVEAVTLAHLEVYIADLRSRPREQGGGKLSPVTCRKWALTLKTFWAWVAGRGYVRANPALDLPLPRERRMLPKPLTPKQARDFMAAPMLVRDRAAISLMIDSGIRLAECCALDVEDVDNECGTILIRNGKGGKQRKIVFGESARLALLMWIAVRRSPGPALFVSERQSRGVPAGSRLHPNSLYRSIKAIARSVGLGTVVSPHVLRHTFATFAFNYGASLPDVQAMLGHEKPSTTMGYLLVATDPLAEHHRHFSPLERLKGGK